MADLIETNSNGVTTLTLNRPDRLNALSLDMIAALVEALYRLGKDTATGAIVVTGAGRGFCAGGDVRGMAERGARGHEERVEDLRHAHQVPMLLRTVPKVVIAMVNGPVAGAGLALAMACDMRFAARSAKLGTAFTGMGLTSDWGATWTMSRLVGTAKAREMFYLPDMIGAEEAARIGLVNRVVDDDALLADTMDCATRIAAGPHIAQASVKRCLFAAEQDTFQAVLDLEAMYQARASLTEDHLEARAAFAEKRKPVFRGR